MCVGIAAVTVAASAVLAQNQTGIVFEHPDMPVGGWQAFTDIRFLANATLTLLLAAGLGAVFAMHPRHAITARSAEDIEAPRIYVLYSFIGAIIGIMVVRFGLVVGFVLFGIGGLMRFRTVLQSANRTGRVILVTLIGLACGLDLPHVAVLATLFSFALMYVLDRTVTYRIDVRGIPEDRFVEASQAYHELVQRMSCKVMSERKNPAKSSISIVFRCPHRVPHTQLVDVFEQGIDREIKGSVNWEID